MRIAAGHGRRSLFSAFLISISLFLLCATVLGQAPRQVTAASPGDDLAKYPGLLPEFAQLFQKIQNGVQSPPLRTQSRLLPLLPSSTIFYAALPNSGNASQQALSIFHQELTNSPVLSQWWHSRDRAEAGPKIENAIEKFGQLSQFLGDEIVISGALETPKPPVMVIAEVRKPGLKEFLDQNLKELNLNNEPPIRIFDPESLAAASDTSNPKQTSILVRPDFVVGASSVQALRYFNHMLDEKRPQFAATPFGQKMIEGYRNGASVLAGIDVEQMMKQGPGTAEQRQSLERLGIANAKYLVWEHKSAGGLATSEAELSFSGPRRGIASWLASPAHVRGLDFVSPHPLFATTVVLKNFADLFDDVVALASSQNPNQAASLQQMQQALHLDLKKDLLHHFDGEITVALEKAPPEPAWVAAARVNDVDGLQETLSKLMMTMPVAPEESEENGVRYHVLRIPAGPQPIEIAYTFVDGYMVIAPGRALAAAAVARLNTGDSLSHSQACQASVPPNHPEGVSALFYEDPLAFASMAAARATPEMAQMFAQVKGKSSPIVICAYAAPDAIREASTNGAADAGAMMVVAAIAIPNLMRARIAANESSAVANLRIVNTAEVSYAVSYPQKGYARDLASLGPDPRGPSLTSSQHAGLIDQQIGSPSCTANASCSKDGYSFSLHAVCGAAKCSNYVAFATPLSSSTGVRSFCSTGDAVIRVNTGAVMTESLTVAQCKQWVPLQ